MDNESGLKREAGSKGVITWRVFSPVNRAEIVLRLHGNIQPGVTQNCSSSEAKIFTRAETIKSRNEAILVCLTTKNLFLSFLHLGETVCCI